MKKYRIQQKTERRISAGLRLALVALLLVVQIALVVGLSLLLQQRMALGYLLMEVIGLFVAVRVYTRPGSTSYKIGWILLVLAVPVAGLILYWLWNGESSSKRLTLQKRPKPPESASQITRCTAAQAEIERQLPEWSRLACYMTRQGFPLYSGTDAVYLDTGEAYLNDLLAHMEQAKRFIFLEYYIVARGQLFDRMLAIFRRKRAEGVEIKFLFDDFGSMMRFGNEEIDALQKIGVEVMIFNPVHQYVNRLYFNYRDHRKIACIDGEVAYTGGANLADEYANITERFGYWKDCGVRLTGRGAWGLTRDFIHLWERMGGTLDNGYDYYRPRFGAEGEGFVQPFVDGPDNNPINTAEDAFLQLIAGARETLTITTPYLAIDEPMMRALCLAADSGVKVQLLMPGIPDHKFAYLVAESYWGELMRHGVEIDIFTPGLLHGKTVLADGKMAFVGSVNMDYRSFQLHFECGTLLYGTAASQPLAEDMARIAASGERMTMKRWKSRPWYHKALGTLLRLFAMWM